MLMQNKKGLIMGVANDRSIAWGIAKKLAEQGAEVAFTYQGEALKKRVEPLAKEIGSSILIPCDVSDSGSMRNVFETLKNDEIQTLFFLSLKNSFECTLNLCKYMKRPN